MSFNSKWFISDIHWISTGGNQNPKPNLKPNPNLKTVGEKPTPNPKPKKPKPADTRTEPDPLPSLFTESKAFENPTAFRLDSFADDDSTRHLYSLMIRPGFLPVGMSTSNRIIKPGYETYQPVIAARQFGLGQVSPHFHINHLVESRADLPDTITSSRYYSMFDNLHIPIPADLSFTFSSDGFGSWWGMWKTHVFRKALGPLL